MELLLAKGADVNAKTTEKDTYLLIAASIGNIEIMQQLLAAGANDKIGWVPLHGAAEQGHEAAVQLLLDKGADVNAKDRINAGDTPLHAAASGGFGAVIQMLLDQGADVNHKNKDDLNGADLNVLTREGASPLHGAADQGHGEFVRMLLGKGAAVNLLRSNGADANLASKKGEPPLHRAAKKNFLDDVIVRMLLDHGADVRARTRAGATPEDLASASGQEEVVELLRSVATRWGQCEAFAMGHHKRLGAGSRVLDLHLEVVRMVLDRV
ncbi:ankyrin repeat-containing domain protein [Baffinella frigidus]|nr:ankyrin repeat-containing domain protein [Cryptophyta sp. CCMP2293]